MQYTHFKLYNVVAFFSLYMYVYALIHRRRRCYRKGVQTKYETNIHPSLQTNIFHVM